MERPPAATPSLQFLGVTNMLSTNLAWILSTILSISCVCATLMAVRARADVARCLEWIEKNNKNSVTLKRMAELESEMTEVTDAVAAYGVSLKKLRSRVGMRKVREERNADDVPDHVTDPEGYKRAMRLKIGIVKP